jgi:lipopolysaccharide/colanic/teichoic acid biosynthesis glycosyltransferase
VPDGKTAETVEEIVNVRRSDNRSPLRTPSLVSAAIEERIILNEPAFRGMISMERKRSERSRKPFLLMLIDEGQDLLARKGQEPLQAVVAALSGSTRETDVVGWYQEHATVGVMFTEIGDDDRSTTLHTLIARVSEALRSRLTFEQFDQISLSFHVFPDDWEGGAGPRPANPKLYPDLAERDAAKKSMRVIKRVMDIAGSLAALAFLSPVFLVVAVAIKLSSKGPVLFCQHRLGERGVPFSLLKFRSMHANSNDLAHKEYMRKLIAGVADKHPTNGNGCGVYKLTRDTRITPVGAFLRRTSLDELPQLINVLTGDMSLVGPRPPIDYEVEKYDLWHRRRLMEAKPGITGLWQVGGRNRIPFDDMVRLDLQYAKCWSPWLDLKILLRTPKAVIEGAH